VRTDARDKLLASWPLPYTRRSVIVIVKPSVACTGSYSTCYDEHRADVYIVLVVFGFFFFVYFVLTLFGYYFRVFRRPRTGTCGRRVNVWRLVELVWRFRREILNAETTRWPIKKETRIISSDEGLENP